MRQAGAWGAGGDEAKEARAERASDEERCRPSIVKHRPRAQERRACWPFLVKSSSSGGAGPKGKFGLRQARHTTATRAATSHTRHTTAVTTAVRFRTHCLVHHSCVVSTQPRPQPAAPPASSFVWPAPPTLLPPPVSCLLFAAMQVSGQRQGPVQPSPQRPFFCRPVCRERVRARRS
jgi:hypothetical protein